VDGQLSDLIVSAQFVLLQSLRANGPNVQTASPANRIETNVTIVSISC